MLTDIVTLGGVKKMRGYMDAFTPLSSLSNIWLECVSNQSLLNASGMTLCPGLCKWGPTVAKYCGPASMILLYPCTAFLK